MEKNKGKEKEQDAQFEQTIKRLLNTPPQPKKKNKKKSTGK